MDINSIRKLFRSRSRSRRAPIIAAALIAGAALNASAETWYFNGDVTLDEGTSGERGFVSAGKWKDASGNAATAFNSSDTYVVRNNSRLRILATDNNNSFAGGPIYFGDLSYGGNSKVGRIRHEQALVTFPEGIHFVKGSYQISINNAALRDSRLSAGRIDVDSLASDPFQFVTRGEDLANDPNGRYSNRRLLINAPLYSGSEAGILIGDTSATGGGTNFTIVLAGDCSNYKGRISVKPRRNLGAAFGNWDTCLMLADTMVDGTIGIYGGSAIEARKYRYIATSYATGDVAEGTVGTLELAANSVIVVSGDTTTPTNSIIHVRDSLSLMAPVAVNIKYDPTMAVTNKVTILTAPASSTLDAADFVLSVDTVNYISNYSLAVENDGETKSLVAVFEPIVSQISNYDKESTKEKAIDSFPEGYSSLTNAAAWSDTREPHSGVHYISARNLRTLVHQSSDYDFPGLSFTKAGGQLTLFTKSFRVPKFITLGSPVIWIGAWTESGIVADMFEAVSGTVDLGAYCDKTLTIDAEIVGAANLLIRGVSGTSATKGSYVLTGINTNFVGNITVSHREQRSGRWDFDTHFQTLYVNDGRNLGGAKEAFDANALTIKDMARLAVTNANVTLAAGLNRGLYIDGIGRLYVQEPGALTVNWPRRIHGTMFKEGNGTLALGGDGVNADVYIDGGQSADATNRLFVVTNGFVKALSAGCVDGLTVSLAANATTGLKLDYTTADADLAQFGFKNVATDTPFVGTIDVIVENYSREAYDTVKRRKLGLITVKTSAADGVAGSINLQRDGLGSVAIERADDAETGYTTFSAVFSPGLTIVFR